jgi:DNA-binding FadR family transcriptional regulator
VERAYRHILADLMDDAVTGRLPAGDWLPRLDDIAARYACSPNTAREAVRALEERQVVTVHAGQGQQLLEIARWKLLDGDVAEAVLLRHSDPKLLAEAVDFMCVAETRAAQLAARRLYEGDLRQLSGLLDLMRVAARDAPRDDRFVLAETDFHRTLIALARNRFIASALEHLHPVLVAVRQLRSPDRAPAVIGLHERIMSALGERDPTATAAAINGYARQLASLLRI